MDWLNDLLSTVSGDKPKESSSQQLERIQREEAAKPATAAQEAEARRAGFRNHREYMAWLRNRENKVGGTVEGNKSGKAKPGVKTAMSWHPAVLLDYVSQAIQDATKKKDN